MGQAAGFAFLFYKSAVEVAHKPTLRLAPIFSDSDALSYGENRPLFDHSMQETKSLSTEQEGLNDLNTCLPELSEPGLCYLMPRLAGQTLEQVDQWNTAFNLPSLFFFNEGMKQAGVALSSNEDIGQFQTVLQAVLQEEGSFQTEGAGELLICHGVGYEGMSAIFSGGRQAGQSQGKQKNNRDKS